MSLNSILKIVFVFIFSTTNFVAQNKSVDLKVIWENTKNTDSIRFKALDDFYKKTVNSQPNLVIQLTNFHLQLADEKNNKKEKIRALNQRCFAYLVKNELTKSEQAIKEAIKVQITLNDKEGLAGMYNNLANIYQAQNKYIETIKYYNYSLKIFKETKNLEYESTTLGNLGLLYFDLKNYEIALSYYQKALLIYKKLNNTDGVSNINLNIAEIDYEEGNYKKVIENSKSALIFFLKDNNLFISLDCYIMMAKSYQKLNLIDEAFININKSLALSEKLENNAGIIECKIFLAELYLKSDIIKATQIGEEALAILDSNIDKETKASLYKLLYKCYKKTNKIALSHEMYEKYIVYNDSVVKEQSNLELMKEAVNQEYKIALSKTTNSFQESEKKLKRNQFIKLILVILISLLLVFTIYFFARKKSITNRKEREALVEEIENLKKNSLSSTSEITKTFELNRLNIETTINRKLNETDWNVLNVLLENPVISNKEIASQIFLSIDGIGSSLRRMYDYFEIGESKYKKTDLIRKAIQFSNNS